MAKSARKPPPLSAAQLQVMNVVWERREAGVAEIWQELSRNRPVARNTVQTTLARLAAKGWLRHRREGNTFLYSAAHPRRHALANLVSRLIDTAFAGSASSMVLSLIEDGGLSEQEARRIRDLIAEAAQKQQGGRK